MVVCFQNSSDLLWEKIFSDWEEFFEIRGWGWEFTKLLRKLEEFILTVKTEKPIRFMKRNTFLTCSFRFLRSNTLEQL